MSTDTTDPVISSLRYSLRIHQDAVERLLNEIAEHEAEAATLRDERAKTQSWIDSLNAHIAHLTD